MIRPRGCLAIDRRAVAIAVVACVASLIVDRWAYGRMTYSAVYEHDWGRLLRVVGYWPTWCVAALALWLNDGATIVAARRRALLLLASPTLAGIAAEAFKLVLRRERPEARHGEYVFRAFVDRPFSSAGIGSPSSHAAVAFGGTAILAWLFPRARWVWFTLAIGCSLTRVLARAHFLSDVVAGAIVGLATAAWLNGRYAHANNGNLDDA